MLLRRISYRIALQFTCFVFLLFVVNGAVFLAADFRNLRRQAELELQQSFTLVVNQLDHWPAIRLQRLPPPLRERIRIINLQGAPVYVGGMFEEIPFSPDDEHTEVSIRDERYSLLTLPILKGGVPLGYMQVVGMERVPLRALPHRVQIYLIVSLLVSLLTFLVGLFFARRSLKPAEDMMERLEQFTQDASHELRTPLAALQSSLDLALRNGKLREGIESAREDVRDVTTLVERLLELARLDRLSLDRLTVDGTALVGSIVERFHALAKEKNVELRSEIDLPVLLQADSALLKQLLSNLLSNAIKFTPSGGTVTVRLTKKLLSVADTGIGIRKEALPQVFNRFFQADPSRCNDGFGLGLALVKRIVDLHRWTIAVKSQEGKGTTFTVFFS